MSFARLKALMLFQLQAEHVQALQDTAIHIVANQDDFLVPVHKSQDLLQNSVMVNSAFYPLVPMLPQ